MVKINASLSKEKRILKAAEQVFSHKGYTQATLDEIIQIADTGKGTVYKYYKNEEGETFSDQFRGYVEAFLHFLEKNETLWSVILFELLNQQAGWRLLWDEKKQDWRLDVRWGKKPEEKDVAMKLRYAELIYGETQLLQSIFQKAIDRQYLKPLTNLQLMSQNFYFSIFMLSNQGAFTKENRERVVDGMIDRFLYGHKEKTAAR